MEFCVFGTKGHASAHVFVGNSQGIMYEEEELTPSGEFTDPSQGRIGLKDLIANLSATTLPCFFNSGATQDREYEIECYVGRLIGPNEVIFTIKEHPIVSGVARRDEKVLAVYRATPPYHTAESCERLHFNYPRGVIEVEVSCNPTGVWLAAGIANTATHEKLAGFFLYTRP